MICQICIVVLLSNICVSLAQSGIIVTITQGQLQGVRRTERKGGHFYAFRNIPYAKPPIGALRFHAPVPDEGWQGIRDASPDVPACYQAVDNDENNTGQEDCLYLNVFTKCINPTQKCAVMVYIHGGSFMTGSPREELYNPEFLLTENIVLVVPSYRLGILGFISFNSTEGNPISDNPAMRDQLLALKWVRSNVEVFGGDPEKVTIFGESAGAASVHYHLFSPLSNGLFHKMIAQSGFVPLSAGIAHRGSAELVANELNIDFENSDDLLQKLQKASVADVVNAQKLFFSTEFNGPAYNFPVVEGDIVNAFLPIAPEDLLEQQDYNHVPMIAGYTDKEGIIAELGNRLTGAYLHLYNTSNAIPYNLYLQTQQAKEQVAQEMRNFYFKGQNGNPLTDFNEFIDLITDITQLHAQYETVRKHALNGDKIFFYRFGGDTTLNVIKRLLPSLASIKGAAHGDDVGYLYNTEMTPEVIVNSIEHKMIEMMVKMWTNFAIFSDPTPTGTPFKWLPVVTASADMDLNYLNIVNEGTHNNLNPDYNRAKFWKYIYDNYGYQ